METKEYNTNFEVNILLKRFFESFIFKLKAKGGDFIIGENKENPSEETNEQMVALALPKISNPATGGKKTIHYQLSTSVFNYILRSLFFS